MPGDLPAQLEACPDGVALLDATGTIQAANAAYASLHGVERNALPGTDWPPGVPADERERLREAALPTARDSDGWRGEIRGERDQQTVHKSVTVTQAADGEFLCFARDITGRIEREQRLERQNERLDRFASVISHDLKEPLTIAMGKLELLKRECDSDHLDDIADAHDRMEELIDDVLTLAREGDAVGETERVDVGQLARSTFEMLDEDQAALSVDPAVPAVEADPERLRTLFQNLFGNAIEHGRDAHARDTDGHEATTSGPQMTSNSSAFDSNRRHVAIEVGTSDNGFYVADDGPGIPPGKRDAVFEYGYTDGDGTGLGLNIVHSIVDAHGWDIELTASRHGGARFEIRTAEDFVDGDRSR